MMPHEVADYFARMVDRARVLSLQTPVGEGFLTFFLLQSAKDVPRFYDRRCWTVLEDTSDGTLLYIDKVLVPCFDRRLWTQIERLMTDRFPQWEQAVWYRPGHVTDIRHTYRRRILHGASV